MNLIIKKIEQKDIEILVELMRTFYESDAVFTNGSEKIFRTNLKMAISDNDVLQGYVFLDNTEIIGYSLIAKSFSTEFGKECFWFEDLYLIEEYRGKGIVPQFITYIKDKYKDKMFRLEVEFSNKHAVYVYEKCGFNLLPYKEYYCFS
jgi:GNAT superfamily N-acetyltransferase